MENIYDKINKYSNSFDQEEIHDIALTLIRRAQIKYNLSSEDVNKIWISSHNFPTSCICVANKGLCKGTKCRNKIKEQFKVIIPDEEFIFTREDHMCKMHSSK